MSVDDRLAVMQAYVGDRTNRRHKPGRALERLGYRFDVLVDYGAFRDLQRHRMLTIEWQSLTPHHGYARPEAVDAAGERAGFDAAMERSASLYEAMVDRFPSQAAYAVSLAYRVRFVMQLNAREAMHLLELRTTPQGHPAYRQVGQEMHRLIAEEAGHQRRGRDDVVRRPQPRAGARATRRRAAGRGPAPGGLTDGPIRRRRTTEDLRRSRTNRRGCVYHPARGNLPTPPYAACSPIAGAPETKDDMADDEEIDDGTSSRRTSTTTWT